MPDFKAKALQRGTYVPRGPNVITTIFKNHFEDFKENYQSKLEDTPAEYKVEHIVKQVEGLLLCGDYTKGIARIQCTNLECRHEYLRPFSCKKFGICPSCAQKRAILFGEHVVNDVLLRLPHRQFVFTFPKMLRIYFRNNKLFAEIAKLINSIVLDYYKALKGKNIKTACVMGYQSFGEFARHNPHFHALLMEGCFDEQGKFHHLPIKNIKPMTEYFRKRVIQYFLKTGRINQDMARNLFSWKHSGFSIDNSVILYPHDDKAKEALAQYMARYSVSLKKIVYEPVKGKVLFHTKYNKYFKENLKVFSVEDFISELVQHVPPPRMRVIRYYGLYSSRSRQKWEEWEYVSIHAPQGWKDKHLEPGAEEKNENLTYDVTQGVHSGNKGSVWARLIAKVYEVNPLVCTKCGAEMKVVAVIMDSVEVEKILKHLAKTGKSPPGVCVDELGMVS